MLVKVCRGIFCRLSVNVWNGKKASKKEKKQNCKNKSLYKQPICTGKFFVKKLGEKICENPALSHAHAGKRQKQGNSAGIMSGRFQQKNTAGTLHQSHLY